MGSSQILLDAEKEVQTYADQLNKELCAVLVYGESGGGMVKAGLSFQTGFVSLEVSRELYNDPMMLSDLAAAAINDAIKKLDAVVRDAEAKLEARKAEVSSKTAQRFVDEFSRR